MLTTRATRVVIDMQEAFDAACRHEVVLGVAKEIMTAMNERAPIVIVEYTGSGKTLKGLMDIIGDYPHVTKVRKSNDGGAREVMRAIRKSKFSHRYLRVCGVNTDCCVRATVNGLLVDPTLADAKIELVKNACGTSSRHYDWREYPKHPNLKLV